MRVPACTWGSLRGGALPSPDHPPSPAALTYHYETQCLPTPAAWFAHHLPVWLHRLSVVATFLIEIAVPPLFFAPARRLRLAAFYSQVSGPSAIRKQAGIGLLHHPVGPVGDWAIRRSHGQRVRLALGRRVCLWGQSTASLEDGRLRWAGA